jgi:hypothetical protein
MNATVAPQSHRFVITERATGQVLRVTHDRLVMRQYAGNDAFRVAVG